MHRIVLPDGTTRQSELLRWARVFGYGCIGLSGLLLLASQVFQSGLDNALASFLLVGGFSAASGSVSRRWAGEFLGLPLAAAGMVSLGVISWEAQHEMIPMLAAANLAILTGFALLLLGRWRQVLTVYRLALWVGRRDSE